MDHSDNLYGDGLEFISLAKSGTRIDEICLRALESKTKDLRALVDLGIMARDASLYDICDRVFLHILALDEKYNFAHYELAQSLLLQGRHIEACIQLETLLVYHPNDVRACLVIGKILGSLGVVEKSNVYLNRALNLGADPNMIHVTKEFCDYIQIYPEKYSLYLVEKLSRSSRFLSAATILGQLRDAIERRVPFSLIRFGDGEGAFLQVDKRDKSLFRELCRHNQRDRANVWFNGELDLDQSGFNDTAMKIGHTALTADVVGIPYVNRVKHEYRLLSTAGVPTITNILRFVSENVMDVKLCSHDIHVDLNNAGLVELISSCDRVGLISCHSRLPSLLQDRCGVAVDFYKLPGEKGMAHALTSDSLQGVHFPDVYDKTMLELSKAHRGMLFLVAGGLLGKFYCSKIKEYGGIAIDIGSVADLWVGANTRPGFSVSNGAL